MSKIVLITGCSSGIGRNLAERLTQSGYTVVATARNVASMTSLEAALKLPLDVTDQNSVDRAVQDVLNRFGQIDVLVNNAGYAVRSAMEEVDESVARSIFDVNVWGLLRVTKAVLPHMRTRGAGRVIQVGSVVGKFTLPLNGPYSSSKHAVESISDAMRMELKPFGIQVILIEPGTIRTQFMATSGALGVSYSSNPDSPYAMLYREFQRLSAQPSNQGADPARVSKIIQRSIEARHPKARYTAAVPPIFRIILMAGDGLRDFIMQRAFRITSAQHSTSK